MRRVSILLLLVCLGCQHSGANTRTNGGSTGGTRIPRDASRFEIVASTDSTVTFRVLEATWVRAGLRAHAVDPRQRDAIIAQLTVSKVDTSGALATITGKVSEVLTDHVVLIARPKVSWWRDARFWKGAGAGAAFGAAVGVAAGAGK